MPVTSPLTSQLPIDQTVPNPQQELNPASFTPDDLQVLDRFLDAWCEENRVEKSDTSAREIASALIEWYRRDAKRRNFTEAMDPGDLPLPADIEVLLRRIT